MLSPGQTKSRFIRSIFLVAVLILIIYHALPSSTSKLDSQKRLESADTNEILMKKPTGKVKATFVTLARNEDLWELLGSIQSIEDRFNHKFHYDWVFLNDVKFTDEFIEETTKSVSGDTKYGVIPYDHWSVPLNINIDKAQASWKEMEEKGVLYGGSLSYRHMCRYESGFFFRHPLMDEYDYYWRVEPSVKFYCDLDYDVFSFMKENDLEYGFTIALNEYIETIPTLWDTTKDFISKNPQFLAKDNSLDFISNDDGETYNTCHFWSNFEIGKLDFLRSKAYTKYFDHLDKAGGFFYERWGDAPVHSIAASLFLDKSKLHFFEDVGYYHGPFTQCPLKQSVRKKGRCSCNPRDDITFQPYSCLNRYYKLRGMKKPEEFLKYFGEE